MRANTNAIESTGPKSRAPKDAALRRALLRAMKGALQRSIVLLPLSEDEDRLQECLEGVFGFTS